MSKRPNILIFNPDQWRSDVMGHLGNPAAITPNLDRLVQTDALSFRSAFCQNTVCTPSRCSFMTGWYPHTAGHRTMTHMLRSHEPNLLSVLKNNGYHVWWGGKNDLLPGQDGWEHAATEMHRPTRDIKSMWKHDQMTQCRGEPGSDTYYSFFVGELDTKGEDHYHDGDWENVLGATEFIRDFDGDEPFCMYLPLTYPHPPYAVEEPFFSAIDRNALPTRTPAPDDWDASGKPSIIRGLYEKHNMGGWSEDRWTELRAVYYGMCMRLDHQFQLLVDALKARGLYENTAIFLFSDHGDFTGDFSLVEKTQNTFEDCLSRVPLIIKPPASTGVQPGVTDALAELVDFPATVYEMAGIEPGYDHFGKSLLPVLTGSTRQHRDAVFCEGGRRHGETQCMETASNRDLDTSSLYWPRQSLQHSEGPEHTKAVMCRMNDFKYTRRHYESDELYDLRTDPREEINRIDDPALADELARLQERMLTWFLETSDVVPHDGDNRGFPRK